MKCAPEYWIWLQRTLGAGAAIDDVVRFFGNPEKLYAAGKDAWIESGIFSNRILKGLVKYSPSESYSIMKQCRDNDWHIITYDDECYPKRLRKIKNYPLVLYVQGDADILKAVFSIGVVGTRGATGYGRDVAESLSYSLAAAGSVIVSGGALGVDSSAHEGAINAGGKTIAFLGSGLGSDYLKTNEKLRMRIAQNGALISEFLPMTQPTKGTFPIRNRLISGMSQGLVVVEAGENSGSLITAKYALEQGRDVFAVPGNILSSGYRGTNNLIRDGAKAVFSAMDILEGYIDKYGEYLDVEKANNTIEIKNTYDEQFVNSKSDTNTVSEKLINETKNNSETKLSVPEYATDNAKKLFEMMDDEPRTADELVIESGIQVQDVLSALTELEMYSVVMLHSGKRYSLRK